MELRPGGEVNAAVEARIERSLRFMEEFLGVQSAPAPTDDPMVSLTTPLTVPRVPHEALIPSEGRRDAVQSAPERFIKHHPVVDPRIVVKKDITDALHAARKGHQALVINPVLKMKITNTVHGTNLVDMRTGRPVSLPLREIARTLLFLGSQFNTERFAKLVQRYGPDNRLTQLLFATGKIVETGRASFERKRAQLYAIIDMIRAAGFPHVGLGTRICQNIVATGRLPFQLRLWLLHFRFEEGMVVYTPSKFAGAIIRHPALRSLVEEHDAEMAAAAAAAAAATATDGSQPITAPYVYVPVDSIADEQLDNEVAMREATEYAHQVMQQQYGDYVDHEALANIVAEQMSFQPKKNIVVLAFRVGVIICCGAKNVNMLRRACAIVYEMLQYCVDTPENRLIEEQLIRERGIPSSQLLPSAQAQAQAHALGQAHSTFQPSVQPRKKPGRRPKTAVAAGSGVTKRKRGRPRKNPLVPLPPPPSHVAAAPASLDTTLPIIPSFLEGFMDLDI